MRLIVMLILVSITSIATTAAANAARDAILADLAAEAKAANAAFIGFSAERGATFFAATHTGGEPDMPSCTTCHSTSPHQPGRTRAGKNIEPMAVSKTPNRYTDAKEVAKWFRRNCKSVLGRECTAVEKGDFLTFMISQ
jgi:Domain of unknown function (DUF1924)